MATLGDLTLEKRLSTEHATAATDLEGYPRTIKTCPMSLGKLIHAGADVNMKTNRNAVSDMGPNLIVKEDTPLHFAAASGTAKIVRLLLSHGAIPFEKNSEGDTTQEYALRNDHYDVYQLLHKA